MAAEKGTKVAQAQHGCGVGELAYCMILLNYIYIFYNIYCRCWQKLKLILFHCAGNDAKKMLFHLFGTTLAGASPGLSRTGSQRNAMDGLGGVGGSSLALVD